MPIKIPSSKRVQIDKANAKMVGAIAGTAFVVVFCLFASKALLDQRSYQSRVISAKTDAVEQLKSNIDAAKTLVTSYTEFVSRPTNALGGNPSGTGPNDGDNAKIVLDALPSKYDFPALATSLEKLLTGQGATLNSITGTDDEVNQQDTASPNPEAIEIPFQASITGSYDSVVKTINDLQRSIRPIQIQTLSFNAVSGEIQVSINARTYYQPEKSLTITTKEIK